MVGKTRSGVDNAGNHVPGYRDSGLSALAPTSHRSGLVESSKALNQVMKVSSYFHVSQRGFDVHERERFYDAK